MRKSLIITLATLVLTVACTQKTRHYGSDGASNQASCTFSGSDSTQAVWTFTKADGSPLVPDADSLRVIERGPEGHPMTVCFHIGDTQRWLQFYSDMALRSDGLVRGGLRQGLWTFYFPNGAKQTEYAFVDGKEEGPYRVFRENGAPFYIGQCINGKRVGIWEIYDESGNLATTKDYGY